MANWINIVKASLEEKKISQQALADKIGVTCGQVSHYLTGRSDPPLKKILEICKILDIKFYELFPESSINLSNQLNENYRYIPILDWVSAGHGNIPLVGSNEQTEYVPVDKRICGDNSYILVVKGDSMVSTLFGKKSFLPGEKIIVDPDLTATNGSFVIAVFGEDETVFKQYIVDGPKKFLAPLNTNYPMLEITEKFKIIGVVVGRLDYKDYINSSNEE